MEVVLELAEPETEPEDAAEPEDADETVGVAVATAFTPPVTGPLSET